MDCIKIYSLGQVPYGEALEFQLSLLDKRIHGEVGDALILLEHPPTFTTGRGGKTENIKKTPDEFRREGVHFETVSRGGDVTFHGPGQLVGYGIFDLNNFGRDVHLYLRNLEAAIILALRDFGIEASRSDGLAGVWVGDEKIASIGVGVKRWVTYHGFALNVNTDLSYFDMIVPCGIRGVRMTSIEKLRRGAAERAAAEGSVIRALCSVFKREAT
ncbi:MAG: lipoyl(octanoyl) transferase LipB [Deltaproteobacteria bacterium]